MLRVENLTVNYGSLSIVDDVSFSVDAGQWLMIVGPNGAGKSTLLNAVSQGIQYSGTVSFDGKSICKMKPTQLARLMGMLLQHHSVGYSFSVEEVVRLGRYAHSRGVLGDAPADIGDDLAVSDALSKTGLTALKDQSVLTLSGGELQRTFLAQLLAQNPRLLILDEPTNSLDLIYQKQVFDLSREWLKQPDRAIISVVHDLSLAKAYGTHALLMSGGRSVDFGTIDILTRDALEKAYSMDVYEWMTKMLSQWEAD